MTKKIAQLPALFVRIALAATMLSAVADRFGYWGNKATWGNWKSFEKYTADLTFFLPDSLKVFSAYVATFLEIVLSVLLLLDYQLKWTATATGVLLILFALSMSVSLGPKSALDYSVWIGSAASFMLAVQKDNTTQTKLNLFKK